MSTSTGIVILLIWVVCIIFGPLAIIWSLNTLFGLAIAYTWQTWLAALVLGATVKGSTSSSSSK